MPRTVGVVKPVNPILHSYSLHGCFNKLSVNDGTKRFGPQPWQINLLKHYTSKNQLALKA